MQSQVGARMVFENAKAMLQKNGYNVDKAICTQSYLRCEAALSTTTANYRVPILVNDLSAGAIRATEQRLNLQDLFYVSEMFVGFTSATATATNGKLYTYPNSVIATSAMNTFYNGKFKMAVNNDQIVPAWDLMKHLFVPRTQENTNFNVASPTSPAVYSTDSVSLVENGFAPVEPGWILNGAANIDAQIQLPGAISSVPSNGALVVIFRGLLLQNTTTVK